MANYKRFARPVRDWSSYELEAYNITVAFRTPDKFFPTPDPSLDLVDPAILTSPSHDINNPALSDVAAEYLSYLRLTRCMQDSFVIDFAAETLKLLGYNERCTTVSTILFRDMQHFQVPLPHTTYRIKNLTRVF
ncbi:hypothetical protein E1B28_010455 [Marasmius oreades]|uniref:Uncharacterized protein n=1 Tax=Marasmius oreades TaxID=181124 RepID=A0A9P7RX43_9AGAR|nr:uncharacterized protein E1B28_010455 [Marasmius oreades]KAG7091419.1 hypothetical protein E1B28_010455 [Marasmius oreades]